MLMKYFVVLAASPLECFLRLDPGLPFPSAEPLQGFLDPQRFGLSLSAAPPDSLRFGSNVTCFPASPRMLTDVTLFSINVCLHLIRFSAFSDIKFLKR